MAEEEQNAGSTEEGEVAQAVERELSILFDGFEEQDILQLMGGYGYERFKPGEVIFREGEPGTKIYFIVSGSTEVSKGADEDKVVMDVLGPGDALGEMAIISHEPRSATLTAITACVLYSIDERFLSEASTELQLKLYKNFARLLAERLRRCNARVVELSGRLRAGQRP